MNFNFTKLNQNHYILICSLIGFFFTILLGFVLYTPILKKTVASQKSLKSGNEMRDFYLKLPVPLDFRVYFFNITNPAEVRNGKNPKVQEIGPFCYDAYKEKINLEEDETLDSLTYSPYDTYFFNKTRSGHLKQDDYVTILNPLIVGMINTVALEQPRFLSILNKALAAIFKEKNDIYLTAKIRDILFDGIIVNCTVKDFSATAVCSQFKGLDAMTEVEPNIFRFSLFGSRNGTIPKRISVLRGIKNASDIGRVISINNQTNLQIWPDQTCNTFRGTDGWIFPSFLTPEEGIWTVAADLCRSLKAEYIEEAEYQGVSVRKYTANFGDSNNPQEQCYCPAINKCLPRGVMDLTKCMKVPIYCTLPHFLKVDEEVAARVEGLHPDEDKHVVKILFEPFTGTPVVGQRRIQFNLKLERIQKITIMQNVSDLLHPILWLEEGIELEGMLLKKITDVFLLLKVTTGVKYVFLLSCLGGIGFGIYAVYRDMKNSKVMPVSQEKKSAKSGQIDLSSMKS